MAVYVDDLYKRPLGRYGRMKMSHMVADTTEELHAMADRIGVARKWFQTDHYDICIAKRKLAVAAGAQEITMREAVKIARSRRLYKLNVSADERYYLAKCEHCGFVGSTEFWKELQYDDDADVVCPKCERISLADDAPDDDRKEQHAD